MSRKSALAFVLTVMLFVTALFSGVGPSYAMEMTTKTLSVKCIGANDFAAFLKEEKFKIILMQDSNQSPIRMAFLNPTGELIVADSFPEGLVCVTIYMRDPVISPHLKPEVITKETN